MASVVKVRKRVANDRSTLKGAILEHVATFQVEFDGPGFELPEALYATDGTTSVPRAGSRTITLAGITSTLYFKGSDARREDGKVAEVFVTWSNDPEINITPPEGTDKRGITITVEGVAYDEGVNKDKDGKLLTNSTGDPFPAEVKKTYYDEKVTVRWTANSIDTGAIGALRGKINSAAFTMTIAGSSRTFAAKTVKLVGCTVQKTINAGDSGFDCSFELGIRTTKNSEGTVVGWQRQLVDQGYYVLTDDGRPYRPVDVHGEEITTPVFLDGSGQQLDTTGDTPPDAVLIPADIDEEANLLTLLSGIT